MTFLRALPRLCWDISGKERLKGVLSSEIRRLSPVDIDSVVNVHMRSFRGFFLTFLGPRFLSEFYRASVDDPSGIGYAYWLGEDELCAFVVGSSQPAGFYGRLIRYRWWRFGFASVYALIRQPNIILRLLRALRMPRQELPSNNCGTLMSIAVDPGIQGKGIGKALVTAFLDEARRVGLSHVNLTTDKLNNDSVNKFYLNYGFHCIRTYVTPEGREMNEYLIDL